GMELHPGETAACPAQAELLLGGAVGVVEHRARDPARGDRSQVGNGVRAGQPPLRRIERPPFGMQQRPQLRPAGTLPAHQCRPPSGCGHPVPAACGTASADSTRGIEAREGGNQHPAMVIYVGTSGWQYRDWRGVLYPPGLAQGRWLEYYAGCYG